MTAGDRVRVEVLVKADPATAFAVFTEETDSWWRRGPRFRFGGARRGTLLFESGPNGRLFEKFDDGTLFEVGRIRIWQPGAHLLFEWRLPNFGPGERTEVEIWFHDVGSGTMVCLEHRGWSRFNPEHPVRHGLIGSAFTAEMGRWWLQLVTAMRDHTQREPSSPEG